VTALERDHQFDGGSGIVISGEISKIQVENWPCWAGSGFLKYHHPKVTTGQIHWDYELCGSCLRYFRQEIIQPQTLFSSNGSMALAPSPPAKSARNWDESDLYFRPDLAWIASKPLLEDDLRQRLLTFIPTGSRYQFYVAKSPDAGNPAFDHELGYESLKVPDAGFQLLSLFRFWNIVQYWFPIETFTGEQWNNVLIDFIPRNRFGKERGGVSVGANGADSLRPTMATPTSGVLCRLAPNRVMPTSREHALHRESSGD